MATRSHFPSDVPPPPLGHEPPHRPPLPRRLPRTRCIAVRRARSRHAGSRGHPPRRRNRIPPNAYNCSRHPPSPHHSGPERPNLLGRIFRQRCPRRSPHLRLHRLRRHLERRLHFSKRRYPSRPQPRPRSLGKQPLGAHRRLRRRMPHPARHLRFQPRRARPPRPTASPRRSRHPHRTRPLLFLRHASRIEFHLPTRPSGQVAATHFHQQLVHLRMPRRHPRLFLHHGRTQRGQPRPPCSRL